MTRDSYLIDGQKLLWHPERMSEWDKNRVIAPIYIELSPVSYCNHNCSFCGIDFLKRGHVNLDPKVFIPAIREFGKNGIKSMMIAGEGEPLLHPEIDTIIKETVEAKIDVGLTTNGNPKDPNLFETILPKLTWIKFSVDAGSNNTYSKIHGVKPQIFDQVIENIKQVISLKNAKNLSVTIGIQILLIDENINDLDTALELFTQLKLDYIVLKSYSLHPQMIKKHDVVYSNNLLTQIEEIISKFKASKVPIIFRKKSFNTYTTQEISYQNCLALPFWGYIASNGDFYTCSVHVGDDTFKAGNIYRDSVESILFGEKRKKSISFGEYELNTREKCRINCRMARINEFLQLYNNKPQHINFI